MKLLKDCVRETRLYIEENQEYDKSLEMSAMKSDFSYKDILKHYQLGTSANIKNLKKATLEKDLIDILPGNTIEIQDPAFEYWLKNVYQNPAR